MNMQSLQEVVVYTLIPIVVGFIVVSAFYALLCAQEWRWERNDRRKARLGLR